MKFYDRKLECETLLAIEQLSQENAQMTVITGRRRIGKTTLIKHALRDKKLIYFFVGKKSEKLLCEELCETVKYETGEDLGDYSQLSRLFNAIIHLSKRMHFTLVFDEFQNFKYVNESFFTDLQNIWDSNKDESLMNLILCGSVYTMMTKIFDDRKEPLYGRATFRIKLQPFSLATLKEILGDCHPNYTPDDLLTLYMISGGVAKYIDLLVSQKAFTRNKIIEAVLRFGSYFINEGQELLSDEFGKDYGNYFSVLSAIASGYNERGEIKSYTGIEAGGYLEKLETTYDLLYRYRPFLASERGHNVKYGIKDNFLNFWFRFIYKYRSSVEIGNLTYLIEKVKADYSTYSGQILERYFRQKYRESGKYNIVTNYWEKGGDNEIDLIAVNETDKKIVIGEVKRNKKRISLALLENKSKAIVQKKSGWQFEYKALSLEDM